MKCTVTTMAAMLAGLCLLAPMAGAQTFPNGPITVVVPYPPGGSVDPMARLFAPKLSAALGVPVVIENRGGANGNIGSAFAMRARPDGRTLLFSTNGVMAVNPHVYKDMGFNPANDSVPISITSSDMFGIAVNPSVPANTLADLITYAKAHPGEVTFGTSGTPQQVVGLLLRSRAGAPVVNVPYPGVGGALTDALAGHIKMVVGTVNSMKPFIDEKTLRLLAVTSDHPFYAYPNVPLASATVPGLLGGGWFGYFAPKGTPKPIVDRLNTEIVKVLRDPEIKARLQELGEDVIANSPDEAATFMKADIERWGKFLDEVPEAKVAQ